MLLTAQQIEEILKKTLPQAAEADIRRAAEAIMTKALNRWQEVDIEGTLGAGLSVQCRDICVLGEAYEKGLKIRAFIEKK